MSWHFLREHYCWSIAPHIRTTQMPERIFVHKPRPGVLIVVQLAVRKYHEPRQIDVALTENARRRQIHFGQISASRVAAHGLPRVRSEKLRFIRFEGT